MRRILVDRARRNKSGKRGGNIPKAPLNEVLNFAPDRSADIVALDDVLNTLDKVDARKCQIVELRFFGGLSIEETALRWASQWPP